MRVPVFVFVCVDALTCLYGQNFALHEYIICFFLKSNDRALPIGLKEFVFIIAVKIKIIPTSCEKFAPTIFHCLCGRFCLCARRFGINFEFEESTCVESRFGLAVRR